MIEIQANRLENIASHVDDAKVRRELQSVAAELRGLAAAGAPMVSGADDAVVLQFMGSGASTQVTAGQMRDALAMRPVPTINTTPVR